MVYHLGTPHLPIASYPPEQQRAAKTIQFAIYDLESYLENLLSAVTLFEFCHARRRRIEAGEQLGLDYFLEQLSQWRFIAARDGAMSIWHSWHSIEGVRRALPTCPALLAAVDTEKVRNACKLFRTSFPHFEAVRHAVAHTAELIKNEKSFALNSFSGSYLGAGITIEDGAKNVMLQNSLQGDEYTATFEGKIVTYRLNQDSVLKLAAVRNLFYEAFPFSALDPLKTQESASPDTSGQTPRPEE